MLYRALCRDNIDRQFFLCRWFSHRCDVGSCSWHKTLFFEKDNSIFIQRELFLFKLSIIFSLHFWNLFSLGLFITIAKLSLQQVRQQLFADNLFAFNLVEKSIKSLFLGFWSGLRIYRMLYNVRIVNLNKRIIVLSIWAIFLIFLLRLYVLDLNLSGLVFSLFFGRNLKSDETIAWVGERLLLISYLAITVYLFFLRYKSWLWLFYKTLSHSLLPELSGITDIELRIGWLRITLSINTFKLTNFSLNLSEFGLV